MATNGQWQLSAEAAELYERYVARYILGPWAPLLVDVAHVDIGEARWTWPAGPASWLALRRSGSVRVVGSSAWI